MSLLILRSLLTEVTLYQQYMPLEKLSANHVQCMWAMHVDRKKPPPPGGFPLYCVPDQEPGGRGPPLKNHPQNWSIKTREEEGPPWRTTPKIDQFWGWFFRGGPLPPGSWSGNIVNRNPSPGGGGSFDQCVWAMAYIRGIYIYRVHVWRPYIYIPAAPKSPYMYLWGGYD